jgi:hypothetical protein
VPQYRLGKFWSEEAAFGDAIMSEPTHIIDLDQPNANVFGILPCPACGSRTRWPTGCRHKTHPDSIVCDDCGHTEHAVHKADVEKTMR